MKATVPAKVSKRKAREERLLDFDALADFANLGDQPDDWARFSRKWPRFFPPDIAEWIYINAEEWWNLSNLPDERPDNYRWILRRWLAGSHATITFEEWATLARDSRREMRSLRPPLLFYRNLLRRVWRREDPDGSCLKVLLGFDEAWAPVLEEGEGEKEDDLVFEEEGRLVKIEGHVETGGLFIWKGHPPEKPEPTTIRTDRFTFTWKVKETETIGGLPIGTPLVDGNTGTIGWKCGCPFQRALYYLMQERWRAMLCRQCNKYFVADKAARGYCSTNCYEERRRTRVLDYYYRVGKTKRQKPKGTQTRAHRKKS